MKAPLRHSSIEEFKEFFAEVTHHPEFFEQTGIGTSKVIDSNMKAFASIVTMVGQAVPFVFNYKRMPPLKGKAEDYYDLMRLPYPVMYIDYEELHLHTGFEPKNNPDKLPTSVTPVLILANLRGEDLADYLHKRLKLNVSYDGRPNLPFTEIICGFIYYRVNNKTGENEWMVPAAGADWANTFFFDVAGGGFITKKDMPKDQRDHVETAQVLALETLTLLNCENTVVESQLVPVKLNAKRAKRGKPPIPEIRFVRVSKKTYRGSYIPTGERKSPKSHYRRGHYRTITRTRDGKTRAVWIHPCMVGSDPNKIEYIF